MLPLLVPLNTSMLATLLRTGASQSGSEALVIHRKSTEVDLDALDNVLPFVGKRTIIPRCGDAIPSTSWGSNLHHLLIPAAWESFRQETFAKTGNHCEICGWWNGLDCHELWEYHEPIEGIPSDVCGVQRLVRLMPLCSRCHETYHLGLASMQRRIQQAGDRLGSYNRYTPRETEEYCYLNKENWQRRSRRPWALDLSCMAPGPLIIKRAWHKNEDGTFVGKTQTGQSVTIILGVALQCGKENYPARPPEDGYCE